MRVYSSLLVGTLLTALGCTGVIDQSENAAAAGASGASGTAGGDGRGPSLDPKTGLPSSCDPSQVLPAVSPLLRLTNREYLSTVHDLFPELSPPTPNLPPDNHDEGYDTLASGQSVSSTLIEVFDTEASALATLVTQNLASVLPCSQGPAIDEAQCGGQFIDDLLLRAYRQTPSEAEKTRVVQLFDTARTNWGFAKAIELVVRAVLQSPRFLYRVELGLAVPDRADSTRLTGYEVASRLSYLFWDSMPDSELMNAAATGALDTAAGVETEARRMLDDPRTRPALSVFTGQWLRFEKMADLKKSQAIFPSFTANTVSSLRDAAERYVDYLLWQRGDLQSFFTDGKAYVNDDLAWIYGLAETGSKELALVDVNKAERSGVLTLAGLLAGFAHETADAPVLRGVFVLDRLLCDTPMPPPKGVPPLQPSAPGDAPMTTRQKLELTHVDSVCASCHDAIDGVGFGFEHYDAVGRFRTQENGLPVDASSEITHTLDADGPFDGAIELGQKLAQSKQTQACVAQQLYRYSLGLSKREVDACVLGATMQRFTGSGSNFRELLLGYVTSEAFRRRSIIDPTQ